MKPTRLSPRVSVVSQKSSIEEYVITHSVNAESLDQIETCKKSIAYHATMNEKLPSRLQTHFEQCFELPRRKHHHLLLLWYAGDVPETVPWVVIKNKLSPIDTCNIEPPTNLILDLNYTTHKGQITNQIHRQLLSSAVVISPGAECNDKTEDNNLLRDARIGLVVAQCLHKWCILVYNALQEHKNNSIIQSTKKWHEKKRFKQSYLPSATGKLVYDTLTHFKCHQNFRGDASKQKCQKISISINDFVTDFTKLNAMFETIITSRVWREIVILYASCGRLYESVEKEVLEANSLNLTSIKTIKRVMKHVIPNGKWPIGHRNVVLKCISNTTTTDSTIIYGKNEGTLALKMLDEKKLTDRRETKNKNKKTEHEVSLTSVQLCVPTQNHLGWRLDFVDSFSQIHTILTMEQKVAISDWCPVEWRRHGIPYIKNQKFNSGQPTKFDVKQLLDSALFDPTNDDICFKLARQIRWIFCLMGFFIDEITPYAPRYV